MGLDKENGYMYSRMILFPPIFPTGDNDNFHDYLIIPDEVIKPSGLESDVVIRSGCGRMKNKSKDEILLGVFAIVANRLFLIGIISDLEK